MVRVKIPDSDKVLDIQFLERSKHFSGTDSENNKFVLLATDYLVRPPKHNMRNKVSITYYDDIKISINGESYSDRFCLVQCMTQNQLQIEYFDIFCKKIAIDHPIRINFTLINRMLDAVVDVFDVATFNRNKEVGLWGELVCIYLSLDKQLMLNAWHCKPKEKWDFIADSSILEVKTYTGTARNHRFSFEQLNPSASSDLVIASVYCCEQSDGLSIYDLKEMILKELSEIHHKEKFSKIFTKTVGSSENITRSFSLDQARNELKLFNSSEVPKIEAGSFGLGVDRIKFNSSLEACNCVHSSDNALARCIIDGIS